MSGIPSNRRDLLTGRTFRAMAEAAQNALADRVQSEGAAPLAGAFARLATPAMGTEFSLLVNPEDRPRLWPASHAMEVIGEVERELTVYQPQSVVSRINAHGADKPFRISERLWDLLERCQQLTDQTGGAFDVASHAQIILWRQCRAEGRLPTDREIESALACSGMSHLIRDKQERTIQFDQPGVGLNFGAIGKGESLDLCAAQLMSPPEVPEDLAEFDPLLAAAEPLENFCLSGGNSSMIARGGHAGHAGWPIGIGNPLFTKRRLGTLLLTDQAMATSGSNVQFFRFEGKRYGHILDPRTAWPAEGVLSVTVLAPTAAMADALSTAFFVLGVEKTCEVCDNIPSIGVLLIPPPDRGGQLRPVIRGISEDALYFDPEQVTTST